VRLVAAGVIGLIAAVAAVGALAAARSPVTAFEWSVRPREVARVSPALVLITRDGASDARFSADTWDRAVLARVVTALARAGVPIEALEEYPLDASGRRHDRRVPASFLLYARKA
jgi:CHASE2 domain-containing sensor protein